MDRAKNRRWINPFKESDMVRVNVHYLKLDGIIVSGVK